MTGLARPSHRRVIAAASLALLAAATAGAAPARALEEEKDEAHKLKSCDERVCTLLLSKNPKGDDLKCELSKTWAKATIKEAERRSLTWGFGDARCSVQINVSRATMVAAVTSTEFTFKVLPHTVNCVVEQDGKLEKIKAILAPKIAFRHGAADKIWINLISLEGPAAIKATLWTAASLSDGIGLFHKPLIKSVNRFITKHCPTKYPQSVQASASPAPKANGKPVTAKPPAPKSKGE